MLLNPTFFQSQPLSENTCLELKTNVSKTGFMFADVIKVCGEESASGSLGNLKPAQLTGSKSLLFDLNKIASGVTQHILQQDVETENGNFLLSLNDANAKGIKEPFTFVLQKEDLKEFVKTIIEQLTAGSNELSGEISAKKKDDKSEQSPGKNDLTGDEETAAVLEKIFAETDNFIIRFVSAVQNTEQNVVQNTDEENPANGKNIPQTEQSTTLKSKSIPAEVYPKPVTISEANVSIEKISSQVNPSAKNLPVNESDAQSVKVTVTLPQSQVKSTDLHDTNAVSLKSLVMKELAGVENESLKSDAESGITDGKIKTDNVFKSVPVAKNIENTKLLKNSESKIETLKFNEVSNTQRAVNQGKEPVKVTLEIEKGKYIEIIPKESFSDKEINYTGKPVSSFDKSEPAKPESKIPGSVSILNEKTGEKVLHVRNDEIAKTQVKHTDNQANQIASGEKISTEYIVKENHAAQKAEVKPELKNENDLLKHADAAQDKNSIKPENEKTGNDFSSRHEQQKNTNDAMNSSEVGKERNIKTAEAQNGFEHTFSRVKENLQTSGSKQHVSNNNQQVFEEFKAAKAANLIKEISSFVKSGESKTLHIELTPESLGKVKVIVESVENVVKANIEVENQQIKQFVQTNIDQLKSSLTQSGIQLSSLNISMGQQENKSHHKTVEQKRKGYVEEKEIVIDEKEKTEIKRKLGYNTYEYLA